MCKAGFAGDDAPRAVFRESHPGTLAAVKRQRLDLYFTNAWCSLHCRQTSSSWVRPQSTALDLRISRLLEIEADLLSVS